MALPRFIDIDGRRYLWRDLVALRRAQAAPAAEQPALFTLREDHRPAGERSAAPRSAIVNRTCSLRWSGAVETVLPARAIMEAMDEPDDVVPDDEQAIRDRIADEIVNRELMERLMPDDELVRSSPTITKRHTS